MRIRCGEGVIHAVGPAAPVDALGSSASGDARVRRPAVQTSFLEIADAAPSGEVESVGSVYELWRGAGWNLEILCAVSCVVADPLGAPSVSPPPCIGDLISDCEHCWIVLWREL